MCAIFCAATSLLPKLPKMIFVQCKCKVVNHALIFPDSGVFSIAFWGPQENHVHNHRSKMVSGEFELLKIPCSGCRARAIWGRIGLKRRRSERTEGFSYTRFPKPDPWDGTVYLPSWIANFDGKIHGNPRPSFLGVITHILGPKTFIFHGFGVQRM